MPRNVLLVEDDRVSRDALAYLLRELGHTVCAVYSAEEAKIALHDFNPDVALLDVRLPGLPGDAFALYLRHKSPRTRIIFVSGEYQPHDLDNPERFGPEVDFIPKPVDVSKILTALN